MDSLELTARKQALEEAKAAADYAIRGRLDSRRPKPPAEAPPPADDTPSDEELRQLAELAEGA